MTVASVFRAQSKIAQPPFFTGLISILRRRPFRALALMGMVTVTMGANAPSLLPTVPVTLDSLVAFRPVADNWRVAGGIADQSRDAKTLTALPGTGVLVNTPRRDAKDSLVTSWEHGDLSLEVEFLLPAGSNSGIYLQGRYEVQLFDSWGVKQPTSADCGGIYQRWDPARGDAKAGFEGHAPLANACRAPGLWQRLQIDFQAPRFDARGVKISNAKFLKVMLNGFEVQENVEVTGPTRAAAFNDEQPRGPLVIQGDHGPVAIRHLATKRFDGQLVVMKDLALKFYEGEFDGVAEYEKRTPKREASLNGFADAVTEADGRGAARFTGVFVVPVDGDYAFGARGTPSVRLLIDGHAVVVSNEGGQHVDRVALTAGEHRFQLDHIRASRRMIGNFQFWTEGPGIAPQQLGDPSKPAAVEKEKSDPPVFVDPTNRVLVQRAFVPFESGKRLYAVSVGTPVGVHYAYDLEAATLLRVWRGKFLDASELWSGRGNDQVGKATGPALTLSGKPLLALFADGETRWPERPAQTAASEGYRLELDGQPVFLYHYVGVSMADRIAPLADGKGVTRTLHFSGKPWERSLWVLIADSSAIAPQAGGGYVIGDREYYIDWPAEAPVQPSIRTEGKRQQLVVHLPADGMQHDVTYNLVW
jgi:hypothetical protein